MTAATLAFPTSPGPEAADAVKISDGGAKAVPVRRPHRS